MNIADLVGSEGGQMSVDAANWLAALRWEQVPSEVIANAKLRMLDLLGVMLATTTAEVATRARRGVLEEGEGRYRVIGSTDRVSLPGAAFANGVLSAVLEFDDTHTESGIHVTAPTVSVAFPFAAERGLSGEQLILGVLGGGELCCRLGRIAPRAHDLGLHATGLYGTFGAAYTLAKLRQLSVGETISALGIAGSMAVGSRAGWDEGADAKSMQVGIAAAAGARAVALAAQGVTGPASVFDSETGFYRAHFQTPETAFHFERLTEALGEDWQSLNIASKVYPTGYVSHPFMEAALILRRQNTLDLEAIERITCFAPPMMAMVRAERGEKLRPRTPWHARISVYHQVAEALVTGKIDKTSFVEDNLRDPRINAIADKVFVEPEPSFSDRTRSSGRLVIRFNDGRELTHTVDNMRGTARNPISREDYIAKFRSNASGVLPVEVIERTVEEVIDLEHNKNVSELLRRLSESSAETP